MIMNNHIIKDTSLTNGADGVYSFKVKLRNIFNFVFYLN